MLLYIFISIYFFPISIWFFCILVYGWLLLWLGGHSDLSLGASLDTDMCLCRELLTLHWRIWLSLPAKPHHGRFIRSLIVSNSFCWLRTCPAAIETPWRARLSRFPSRPWWWYSRVKRLELLGQSTSEPLSAITLYFFVSLYHYRMEAKYPNMSWANKIDSCSQMSVSKLVLCFNHHRNIVINMPLVSFFIRCTDW